MFSLEDDSDEFDVYPTLVSGSGSVNLRVVKSESLDFESKNVFIIKVGVLM